MLYQINDFSPATPIDRGVEAELLKNIRLGITSNKKSLPIALKNRSV